MPGPRRKPIAILNAGPIRKAAAPFLAACGGDNDHLFAKGCGWPLGATIDIDLEAGDPLPEAEGLAGVVVSGSPAMVTDRHPWAERAAQWVRDNRERVPMLGVCFGHQLLSHALGGLVDWMPGGPEYGTIEIETTPAASQDPLFAGLPAGRLAVQSAHSQGVMRLPQGAVLLATGQTGVQAARLAPRIWGLQFHPEYDHAVMTSLLASYRDEIAAGGLDVAAALAKVRPTPEATSVLRSFARVCAGSDAVAAA